MLCVNLQQLEIDFLALRILLQRVFEDLFRLGVATIGEIDLRLGNRIDLVGVDVAQTFAAEIAGERVVTGVDDATSGGTEDGIRLDVGAGDDAILELSRFATAGRDNPGDTGEHNQRATPDRPSGRVNEHVVEERRLRSLFRHSRLDRNCRRSRFGFGCRRLCLCFRRFAFRDWRLGGLGFRCLSLGNLHFWPLDFGGC